MERAAAWRRGGRRKKGVGESSLDKKKSQIGGRNLL